MQESKDEIRSKEINLRETIHQAFVDRAEKEASMLDATVQTENAIFDAVKERYQKEWDLIKEDIDRQKEALSEEMSLIRDNFNERKKLKDEEDKFEELSVLEAQLATISADPTRAKD